MIFTILFSFALVCCSANDGEKPDKGGEKEGNVLLADGVTDTYMLITAGGYNYEVPDESGSHSSAPFKHIRQVYDQTLKKHVFEFIIHIDSDDDRGLPNITDRQRNEIKTDTKSPANMVASLGETHVYKWKFRLPEGFTPTGNFTHIHQIKGVGGSDIDMPLITYTARKLSNGKQELQIIYTTPAPNTTSYLMRVPLGDFVGEWVEVTERATYGHKGSYETTITRLSDNKVLLHHAQAEIDLWREGATIMRPKYGIYRSFGKDGSLKPEMRDEILRFADFSLEEQATK